MSLNARTPAVALLALVLSLSASGIARGAGVGQIAEFPTPTAASAPQAIVAGPDGNLWFTESAASKIGEIASGAPAASVSPPTLSGVAQTVNSLTCQAGSWSAWAGQEPSRPVSL
jgi:streptogramin lyase